jgi:hypothetical protein
MIVQELSEGHYFILHNAQRFIIVKCVLHITNIENYSL